MLNKNNKVYAIYIQEIKPIYNVETHDLLNYNYSNDFNESNIIKIFDYIDNIFNYIFNIIIFPFKLTINFINYILNIIVIYFDKLKKKIFFIQDLEQKNVLNLNEINNLKEQIKELTNEKKNLKNNIYQLKQTLKDSNMSKNKLNNYLEITSDKLDISINKNNEQKFIIDNLNYKIGDLKKKINSIQIYEESPINRQKRKAAAKANKKLNKN